MILKLKHEPVGGGSPQFVSEVETGRHVIGRGEENSFVLDVEFISREHSTFFEVRGRWFFQDLGSTNGSWVNGLKAGPSNIRLLRDGDIVQLANVALRVTLEPSEGEPPPTEEVPSLFIFRHGEFQMEFPFAATTSRLALSDLQAYVSLADYERLPAMTVNLRGGKLELVVATDDATIMVNGVEWGGSEGSGRTLFDRDELDAGGVKLVVSVIASASAAKERQIKAALASLPPGMGLPTPGSPETTQALPKVSSQAEPSALMGSGSGLFGGGRPPAGPASSTEGRFAPPPPDSGDTQRKRPQKFVFGAEGDTGPGLGMGDGLQRPRSQGPEMGPGQRYTTVMSALPREADDDAKSPKSMILAGIIAIVLSVALIGVLVSIFRGV